MTKKVCEFSCIMRAWIATSQGAWCLSSGSTKKFKIVYCLEPQDGDIKLLRNIGYNLPISAASHSGKFEFSNTLVKPCAILQR